MISTISASNSGTLMPSNDGIANVPGQRGQWSHCGQKVRHVFSPKGLSTRSYTGQFCHVVLYVYDLLSVVHVRCWEACTTLDAFVRVRRRTRTTISASYTYKSTTVWTHLEVKKILAHALCHRAPVLLGLLGLIDVVQGGCAVELSRDNCFHSKGFFYC